MLLAGLSASAFNYMEFKYADGTTKTLESEGLTILVNNGKLVVSNTKGEKMDVEASLLASMQFSDQAGGVKTVNFENYAVEAFSLSGISFGRFISPKEAYNSLDAGIYLLKGDDGETIKIVVNK